MSNVIVKYEVIAEQHNVSELARKIAIEQSVECPESLITDDIEKKYVGEIVEIKPLGNDSHKYEITYSYSSQVLSEQYNQLLNLCLGNVSMYQGVRLTDIELSSESLKCFSGPRFGVKGIREKLGVYHRPLLATALKPRGYSDEQFANLAYEFSIGGGDIIKDDQNLIGNFDQFKNRVRLCTDAIKKSEDEVGRSCLYFPFISAPFEEIDKYFEWIKTQDIQGVLLAPLILGLDTARGLAKKYDLVYMAHPSFTGSYCVSKANGMGYHLLYGLLMRLAGVDISVFPNTGGRFDFAEKDCKEISLSLKKPLENILEAFPCPAGGMQYKDLHTMCDWYGEDSVFLLGGSLLEYSDRLSNSTQEFKRRISEKFEEETRAISRDDRLSSCEVPIKQQNIQLEYIKSAEFNWEGRESVVYKSTNHNTFKDIKRVELIGKNGEKTQFELRYFEIGQNGYSSREVHDHVHVIIIARGQGSVVVGEKQYDVSINDVLYIKPNTIHQLKNSMVEPFGFYCIVDKQRDVPVVLD